MIYSKYNSKELVQYFEKKKKKKKKSDELASVINQHFLV